jgi:ribosomal-protein-alanine N-acetyltransferase
MKGIRLFISADVKAVAAMDKDRFPLSPYKESTFASSLRVERQKILVYEEEEQIIGFVFFGWTLDEGEIYRLAVNKDREGQGLGKKLLAAGEEFMAVKGVKTVFLEVRKSNLRAQSLYFNSGYGTYRIRKAYYENGEDALCLKKGIEAQ